MVLVQSLLLHVALLNRGPFGAQHSIHKPFAEVPEGEGYITRPYSFWQWRSRRPYWQFLASFTLVLVLLQVLMGSHDAYIQLQGYVALSIEALVPIPQIIKNQRNRSCKGFRISVLINWLVGDFFKMSYFFLSEANVPLAFKLCGFFQTICDVYLGLQFWMYGERAGIAIVDEKDVRLA